MRPGSNVQPVPSTTGTDAESGKLLPTFAIFPSSTRTVFAGRIWAPSKMRTLRRRKVPLGGRSARSGRSAPVVAGNPTRACRRSAACPPVGVTGRRKQRSVTRPGVHANARCKTIFRSPSRMKGGGSRSQHAYFKSCTVLRLVISQHHGSLLAFADLCAILAGGHAHHALEGAGKLALIREAGIQCDYSQGDVRLCQLPTGECDPKLAHIVHYRAMVVLAEHARQMYRMNPNRSGDLRQGVFCRKFRMKVVPCLGQPARA